MNQMTLSEWTAQDGIPYRVTFQGTAAWIPDFLDNDRQRRSLRAQLWNLSDYRVTSVTGGSIWLMPKA